MTYVIKFILGIYSEYIQIYYSIKCVSATYIWYTWIMGPYIGVGIHAATDPFVPLYMPLLSTVLILYIYVYYERECVCVCVLLD